MPDCKLAWVFIVYLRPGRSLIGLFCPLTSTDPVRLVLDTEPTDYSSPFLRHKTSRRQVYDGARARLGGFPGPPAPQSRDR